MKQTIVFVPVKKKKKFVYSQLLRSWGAMGTSVFSKNTLKPKLNKEQNILNGEKKAKLHLPNSEKEWC